MAKPRKPASDFKRKMSAISRKHIQESYDFFELFWQAKGHADRMAGQTGDVYVIATSQTRRGSEKYRVFKQHAGLWKRERMVYMSG